ncbi:MAG: response regulator [Candidatus Eremiobacteraeota bacterium]|nr:response regulator [Candidatus Eremiobacteraeota bacterium]
MDKEKLIQRLMVTFVAELEEHARVFERDLLALEKGPEASRAELWQTLLRTLHSLKGASRSVNQPVLEQACHALEDTLVQAREGKRQPDSEFFQLLFAYSDALQEAARRLRSQQSLSGSPLQSLLPRPGRPQAEPATAEPAPAETPAPPALSRKDVFVRVAADKLDALMDRGGELLVARRRSASRLDELQALREVIQHCSAEWTRLEKPLRKFTGPSAAQEWLPRRALQAMERTRDYLKQLERRIDELAARTAADNRFLEQAAEPLEAEIRRVRLFPFGDGCEGLERTVRDLARTAGKEVQLVLRGRRTELDRSILESLKDPLWHLVRNAVDHGAEPPQERLALGKSARSIVTVAAAVRGEGVEVVVADDGRGLSLSAIREQARRRGLVVPEDPLELAQLVFLPGFSTAPKLTELSGRGVGLDVVKNRVEALRGRVQIFSEEGRGCRFVLNLPLTLSTIRAVLVKAGGQSYALPTACVRRMLRIDPEEFASVEGRDVLLNDGSPVPVISLLEVLGLGLERFPAPRSKQSLVVVAWGERQIALAVDALLAEEEFVVKSLGSRFRRVRHFAGATILSTGHIALILSISDLVHTALGLKPAGSLRPAGDDQFSVTRRRLLVVDDSVTTRSLEKSILEAAGYDVHVAADGLDAWHKLSEVEPDLVVADVEMPAMDGIALCEAIRGSKRWRNLPFVLVTALESQQDKARGLQAGADAYLPKQAFDQSQLLETVARLL